MNRRLGRVLFRARMRARRTAKEVAGAVGWSVEELLDTERRPAEVPCNRLFRLISHYGEAQLAEAQFVLTGAQVDLLR